MNKLPFQPHDHEGPTFKEPWEAQAFALVIALYEQGLFSWDEWAQILSEEIKSAQEAGDADLGESYYSHWLSALEKISASKGLSNERELGQRVSQWRSAYLNTPHGSPVELTTGSSGDIT